MLPTQPLSPTLSGSPRRHMGRRKAVVMLATACALAILLVYEGVAFSRRLEEQRVAAEVKSQTAAIFQQLEDDLLLYPNITQEMVEQAYCSCRRSGFRFQVVKGQMYVAGEIAPWQSRHEYIKHQLLELARVDGQLPDVDIYVASTDFPEYCDITEGPPQCRHRGPHIQHTKTRADTHVLLHPDETFGGWPESKIGPWDQMQQVLSLSAAENTWDSREPALFFSGANLGFPRRNLSLTDWSEVKEMDVRWVDWGDAKTVLPLHDFCKFRHLLHLAGCSWSSRLKYLMLCRSAIVFPVSPWQEFWYPALRPGVNVVLVDDVNGSNKGEHLVGTAQHLQHSPRTARKLGAAAQTTALRVLTTENLQEYWRRLLQGYAQRQTFRPQRHEDAIPLHISLKHPVHVTPEKRTCLICPHPSWSNYNESFCRGVNDP